MGAKCWSVIMTIHLLLERVVFNLQIHNTEWSLGKRASLAMDYEENKRKLYKRPRLISTEKFVTTFPCMFNSLQEIPK